MSDIAFLCHPTVGHLNTLLSMALRMKEDGHRTRFFIPGGPSLGFRLRPDILNNVVDVPAMVERTGLPHWDRDRRTSCARPLRPGSTWW